MAFCVSGADECSQHTTKTPPNAPVYLKPNTAKMTRKNPAFISAAATPRHNPPAASKADSPGN